MNKDVENNFLLRGEKILAEVAMNRVVFLPPILAFLGSIFLYIYRAEFAYNISLTLIIIGIVWTFYSFYIFMAQKIILTDQRLLKEYGLFAKHYRGYRLNDIADIDAQRSPMAKIMGYGHIVVTLHSGKEYRLTNYNNPAELIEKAEDLVSTAPSEEVSVQS